MRDEPVEHLVPIGDETVIGLRLAAVADPVEAVPARAGVSRSTIYRRFPTKDDLFERVVRREAELFFSTLDQATTGCDPQQAAIEAFALGVRLVQDSPLYSRIAESEPELFGMFSRSHVFPLRQFADGIAHTLRRCGADIPEPDLANIADILLRVALGIIVFPPTASTRRITRPFATTPPTIWSRSSAANACSACR